MMSGSNNPDLEKSCDMSVASSASVVQSYSMDSFEAASSDEEESRLYTYDADTFESTAVSESVHTAYSQESFESTTTETIQDVGYSRDSFESSMTGETVTRANFSSIIDSDRSRSDEDSTDTVNSLSESVHSVLVSPRKQGSLEKKEDAQSCEAEREFLSRLMRHLKSDVSTPDPVPTQPKQELTKSEKHVRRFCKKKICSLKEQKDKLGRDEKQRSYNVTEKHPLRKDKACDEYGIPASFIDRLKITNVMEAMEQACNTEIHEPKKCKICRKKLSELRATKFVNDRKAKALDKLIKLKLEEHLYLRDELTLIGEIMKDMPNPRKNFDQVMADMQSRYNGSSVEHDHLNSDRIPEHMQQCHNGPCLEPQAMSDHGNTTPIKSSIVHDGKRHTADKEHIARLRQIMRSHGLDLDLDVPSDPEKVWTQIMDKYQKKK